MFKQMKAQLQGRHWRYSLFSHDAAAVHVVFLCKNGVQLYPYVSEIVNHRHSEDERTNVRRRKCPAIIPGEAAAAANRSGNDDLICSRFSQQMG